MRINGIRVNDDTIVAGKYFLILVEPEGGGSHYELQDRPGRTNQSHEEKLEGWLGTTNNVARYAEGAVEIYADAAGKLRARRTDAEALLEEDNSTL